ncbi:MAG: protoporphyrinogen oxidase [Anaerolineales bacterium]
MTEELPSPSSQEQPHVVIVGGGITGLASAYYLQKRAKSSGTPLRYTLLEKSTDMGGMIVSEKVGGFLIDGGPDCFLTRKPWGVSLCRELGLENELVGTNDEQRKVYVLSGGRLRPMPEGLMLVVPTRFLPFATSPLISLPGKLRMALEPFIPPRSEDGDETLASFMRRRLGEEALQKLAEPLLSGIYVSDPERLSLKSSFPRLLDLEQKYGSLTKGMIAAQRKAAAWRKEHGEPSLPMFVTLREGMQQLVEALEQHLDPSSVRTNQVVHSVTSLGDSVPSYLVELEDGQTLRADAVILTTSAKVSSRLLNELDPALSQQLGSIRFTSTVVITLGYPPQNGTPALDGFGFLVPETENRHINACTWTSTKFDHRSPDGHKLIRCFLGGPEKEELLDWDDQAMINMARQELSEIMGLQAEPDMIRIFRWDKAHPQYDLGHMGRVEAIRQRASSHPGLALAGSSYDGVGVPDCIRQAKEAVERLEIPKIIKGERNDEDRA